MASLLRRGLQCFYCGHRSTQTYTAGLKQWQCRYCDAENYLDAKGQITDPPSEVVNSTQNAYAEQIRRSVSPASVPPDNIFCSTCLKNQALKAQNLADYLPSRSDPAYAQYEKLIPEYSRKLDERYPQVCADCAPRVARRLREAGYTAKTDFLRQRLDGTQKNRRSVPAWDCPPLLAYAGCIGWWTGLLSQGFWHAQEIFAHNHDLAAYVRSKAPLDFFDRLGVNSQELSAQVLTISMLKASLGIAIACLWWNPSMVNQARRGVANHQEFYKLQFILMAVRMFALYYLQHDKTTGYEPHTVAAIHAIALVFDTVISIASYRIGTPASKQISLHEDIGIITPSNLSDNRPRKPSLPAASSRRGPGVPQQRTGFPINKLAAGLSGPLPGSSMFDGDQTAAVRPITTALSSASGAAHIDEDDDKMDLDPPDLQPALDTRQPAFSGLRPETHLDPLAHNKSYIQSLQIPRNSLPASRPRGIQLEPDNDRQSRPRAPGTDYKMAEPRFFASAPAETGLESLMAGVFSLNDTPAEVREAGSVASLAERAVKDQQVSWSYGVSVLAFIASLCASGCMVCATKLDTGTDLPLYTASFMLSGVVSVWNLLRAVVAGAAASLSDVLFYMLLSGVAAHFASSKDDYGGLYPSAFVYALTVHQLFVFVRLHGQTRATPASEAARNR